MKTEAEIRDHIRAQLVRAQAAEVEIKAESENLTLGNAIDRLSRINQTVRVLQDVLGYLDS